MNRVVNNMPPTFSGVFAATVIAGTMSLTAISLQNETLFANNIAQPRYSIHGTIDTYSMSNNPVLPPRSEAEKELKILVNRIIESQIALDAEFDNIIATSARKLYQHGFHA